jgi:hypothetical protein
MIYIRSYLQWILCKRCKSIVISFKEDISYTCSYKEGNVAKRSYKSHKTLTMFYKTLTMFHNTLTKGILISLSLLYAQGISFIFHSVSFSFYLYFINYHSTSYRLTFKIYKRHLHVFNLFLFLFKDYSIYSLE